MIGNDVMARTITDARVGGARLASGVTVKLTNALDRAEPMIGLERELRLWVGLDYDGTLTPITTRSEDAWLAPEVRELLAAIARHVPVWVVSGRDLPDVAHRVDLPELGYAGCHGFDIAGPELRFEHPEGLRLAALLPDLETELRESLVGIDGVRYERKRFTLAVHFREVIEAHQGLVVECTLRVLAKHREFRFAHGKQVVEILPGLPWNKGEAVKWILAHFPGHVPLYAGDDLTDEDGFRALGGAGFPILVAEAPRPTAAELWLRSPAEMRRLLERLALG